MVDENKTSRANDLRRDILQKIAEYYDLAHQPAPFVPGETFVNYGGRVYDERELQNAVEAILDFWLTDGPRVEEFTNRLGDYVGLESRFGGEFRFVGQPRRDDDALFAAYRASAGSRRRGHRARRDLPDVCCPHRAEPT